jgi:hypothetical protein
MPSRTPSAGGGEGAGGYYSGIVRQAERITRRSARIQERYIKKSVKSTTNMVKRASRLKKHPSGYYIDTMDGTVLDANLNIIKRATKMNAAKATARTRVNMVKKSPAARDLKRVTNKVKKTVRPKKRPGK